MGKKKHKHDRYWRKIISLDPDGKPVVVWDRSYRTCEDGYLTTTLAHALAAGMPEALR